MQRQVIQSFQGQTQTTSKLQMLFLRRPVIADQVIWIHQAIQDSVRRLKSLHTRRRRYTVLDVTSAAFFLCFLKQHRLDNNSLFSAERINSRTDGWCELRTSLCSDFLFPFSIVAPWFSRRSSHSLTRLKQDNHAVGRRLWTRLWTRVWLILGAMLIISMHWNSKLKWELYNEVSFLSFHIHVYQVTYTLILICDRPISANGIISLRISPVNVTKYLPSSTVQR